MDAFSQSYKHYGFSKGTVGSQAGIWFHEWLPGAAEVYLVGDFNFWDTGRHRLNRDEFVRGLAAGVHVCCALSFVLSFVLSCVWVRSGGGGGGGGR